jgi:hypothetical protein
MKLKIALLAVAGLLVVAASADAFQWRMSYGQAKNESKVFAKETCAELPECIGWGVGACRRRSLSRFDCTIGLFARGREAGEEIECDQVLHWGVNRGGTIVLKNFGPPHCFVV